MSVDINELRRIASSATQGEWRNGYDPSHYGTPEVTDGETFAYYVPAPADAVHIAAFHPAQCIALLDEIERLRADLDAARANGDYDARMALAYQETAQHLRKLALEAAEIGQAAIANLDTKHDEGLASSAFNAGQRLVAISKELTP